MSRSRGTHVAYHLAMSGGRIDRDAWAREVDALAERFDPAPSGGSNKSAFARRIGRTRKTLERWAARSTDVSHDSVSAVLEALNLPPKESSEILQRVGAYYVVYVDKETPMYIGNLENFHGGVVNNKRLDQHSTPEEPAIPDPHQDPVIQEILADPRWNDVQRAELVQQQIDRMEADLQRRREEYERVLRLYSSGQQAS